MTVETGLCYAQWVNFKLLQFAALQAMFTFGLIFSSSSLSLPERKHRKWPFIYYVRTNSRISDPPTHRVRTNYDVTMATIHWRTHGA